MGLFDGRVQTSGLCRLDNCNNSERSSSRKIIRSNEAPYQMIGKRDLATTLGFKELTSTHFWLSVLSECLSCYLYVFIVCSTRISWTGKIIGHQPNLIAMAFSSGIAMMLLIFTFRTVHVNPTLTISFLLTGRIPICRAIAYIIAHCLGSIAAIAFLYSISIQGHNGALGLDSPHELLQSWQILIVETVISFVVTLATFATCNYSSYSCAKRLILDQLGHSSSSLFQNRNCDNDASAQPHSRRSVAPIVPQISSSNSYDDSTNYEYEYDNHRIYATQQPKSDLSEVPIEEAMHEECQLLAPNGFSLHVTSGQALVIGLAYTVASLSGIPASGASLNPARSLGPAFIMNRWDLHWVYWLGPISGAIIAGMFYEYIFNPTRKTSLCYRPKLFRLSAHDMARVGSKSSRSYQQELQRHQASAPTQPSSIYRPQIYNRTPQHPPASRSVNSNNTLANPVPFNSPWEQNLIKNSTSVAHLQPSYPTSNNFEQMNFISSQQHANSHHQTANFDRSKSTAIINSMIPKQHQSTINIAQSRNNPDLGLKKAAQIDPSMVYDDPNVGLPANQFGIAMNRLPMAKFGDGLIVNSFQPGTRTTMHLGAQISQQAQNEMNFMDQTRRQVLATNNQINNSANIKERHQFGATTMTQSNRPLSFQITDSLSSFNDQTGNLNHIRGQDVQIKQQQSSLTGFQVNFNHHHGDGCGGTTAYPNADLTYQNEQLDEDMYNVLDNEIQVRMISANNNNSDNTSVRVSSSQDLDYVNSISSGSTSNNNNNNNHIIHSNQTPESCDSQRTGELNSSFR